MTTILGEATDSSHLKAAFYGEGGSGKTHTAMLVAMGTRKLFGLPGPIAMFDTERGSDYWRERVEKTTEQKFLVTKSRSLPDLMATVDACIERGVSVLIVDSVTHVWREVCDSYLAELQAVAKERKWRTPEALEFQDWARIKLKWSRWTDRFLNSDLHIIACGRAGDVYTQEVNDRGKKSMVKTGTKMKAEKEFQYEPGLLVEFEHDYDKDDKKIVKCIVWKDRFDLYNGAETSFPTFDFFKPHIAKLRAAAHSPVDTSNKTSYGLDEHGTDDWHREKEMRTIHSESIKSAFALANMDGQSAEEKKRRIEAMRKYWNTTSWTELSERTPAVRLAEGLHKFRAEVLEVPSEGAKP